MKSKIGISLRITNAENYDEKRDSLSHDWIILLEKLDIIPVMIPNTISNIDSFLDEMKISGIILSGGDNIGDDAIRDETEKKIINYTMSNDLPLIGICRGMQVINKFFGGKIKNLENSKHVNSPHLVNINSNLSLDQKQFEVNSFHHNIIHSEDLGKDITSFALSVDDNTVEGLIHNNFSIYGVMWHPERNPDNNSVNLLKKIFNHI